MAWLDAREGARCGRAGEVGGCPGAVPEGCWGRTPAMARCRAGTAGFRSGALVVVLGLHGGGRVGGATRGTMVSV